MRLWSPAGIALATLLLRSVAAAQQPPPPAAPPPAAAAPRTPGTVRVNVRAYRNRGLVRLYTAKTSAHPKAFICEAPCMADVYPGTPLHVTFGDSDDGHDLLLEGKPGTDVDLEVRAASKGPLAGGIVLTIVGGLTALIGLVLVGVAAGDRGDEDLMSPGLITLAVGGGLTVAGIFLIAGRSSEPRVRELAQQQSRRALFRSDLATLHGSSPAGAAFAPLSWGIAF
jgi:hypothetical protein